MKSTAGGWETDSVIEVLIVGAGPVGLACGIEAGRNDLSYVILEKGCLANSIFHCPTNVRFFSTPELLEIGNIPFVIAEEKPTRQEILNYYRRVSDHYHLFIRFDERVEEITSGNGSFQIFSSRRKYRARRVVLATGFYDNPNLLNIPGETLPKVSHYYTEPFSFYRRKVAVIGGKNSAAEAALDLYRHGAEVTLIHRGPEIGQSVKYWIRPDLINRINEGRIRAFFNTTVTRIDEQVIFIKNGNGVEQQLPNDFVFAMTGYHPDFEFMRRAGIEIDEANRKAHYDPHTFETNVPGLYIAGVAAASKHGQNIFIENGREHVKKIIQHIKRTDS
ncbi:MAG: YpdA family putative bacillithiol disulfide reductase [candidate division KSB1 bacterium]|nr:YpdA family putative bacillithiol disulfide reductase [candidate division KSB1 bacterium]